RIQLGDRPLWLGQQALVANLAVAGGGQGSAASGADALAPLLGRAFDRLRSPLPGGDRARDVATVADDVDEAGVRVDLRDELEVQDVKRRSLRDAGRIGIEEVDEDRVAEVADRIDHAIALDVGEADLR